MPFIFTVIVGAIIGIFINYFSDVLPVSRRITRPICKTCDEPYGVKDYLFTYRCSTCGTRISSRSIIVIITSIAASIFFYFLPLPKLSFWALPPILIFLGVIIVIDIEHRVVLIQTTIVGFVLLAIYGMIFRDLSSTIYGTLGGFLIMIAFYFLGIGFTKIMGVIRNKQIDEVAFGFGDVCMGAILGSLVGWPSIIGAVFISILAFATFSIALFLVLILVKKYHAFSNTLPFTIFLIFGAIAVFYL